MGHNESRLSQNSFFERKDNTTFESMHDESALEQSFDLFAIGGGLLDQSMANANYQIQEDYMSNTDLSVRHPSNNNVMAENTLMLMNQ